MSYAPQLPQQPEAPSAQAGPGALPGHAIFVPDPGALLATIAAQLEPLLKEHGFVPGVHPPRGQALAGSCRHYRNEFANGAHELQLSVAAQGDHLAWSVRVASWFDRIGRAAAYFEYGSNAPEHAAAGEAFLLEQQAWLMDPPSGVELGRGKTYVVRTINDAGCTVADMAQQMKRRLWPILALFKSARGLNIVLNPTPVSSSFYFNGYAGCTRNVLAAYYARDPQLEALCTELLERAGVKALWSDRALVELDKLRRCIAYVRANPLKD